MPRFTSPDGLSLHYTDEGAGLPILCLPGLTRTGEDFSYVTPHLHDCRLIKPDYRGRGQSDWAPDPMTYSVPIESGDILALMDHLELDRAAFLGTSRGGLIAMGLAAQVPDRVIGVALNDVGPVLEMAAIREIVGYLGLKPAWKTHTEAAAGMPLVMQGFANVPASRWLEEARHLYIETPQGLDLSYDPKLRDAAAAAAEQDLPDLWPFFDTLSGKPVCAIRGANSTLLSPETFEQMRQRRPDMIDAEVPNRAHVPYLDEPEAVLALRTWLQEMP